MNTLKARYLNLVSLIYLILIFTHGSLCGDRSPPLSYVAIGDSLAAGVGAGDPFPEQSGECKQTEGSYAVQFNKNSQPNSFTFLACHNATIAQIREHQVPQIPASADLVSITAGTMNFNLTDIIHYCDLYIIPESPFICNGALGDAENRATDQSTQVNPELSNTDPVFREMQYLIGAIKNQAPNAMIVILGFYKPLGSPVDSCFLHNNGNPRNLETRSDQKNWINKIMDEVNDTLNAVASKLGVTFKNPNDGFNWHRYCDARYSQSERQTYLNYLSPQAESCLMTGKAEYSLFSRINLHDLSGTCGTGWDDGYYLPTSEGHGVYEGLLQEAWNEGGDSSGGSGDSGDSGTSSSNFPSSKTGSRTKGCHRKRACPRDNVR